MTLVKITLMEALTSMTMLNDVFRRGVGNEPPPFAISRFPSEHET
jgi:hypothetical protein